MILICPSCDTRYYTDAAALGKEGRQVRCATCGHSWFAKTEEDGSVAVSKNTGLTREQVERLRQTAAANAMTRSGPHSEIRAREAARRRRNRLMASVLAWAMGFVIFAGAATAAVTLRNQVADAWPQSASVYRLVGLDVNRFGLDFEGVDAKRSFDGTTPVLTVTGWAVNSTDVARPAPRIRISLRDEAGDEVQAWTENLPVEFIEPGDRVDFVSQAYAPPVETYSLTVTYAPGPRGQIDPAAAHGAAGDAHGSDVEGHAGEGDAVDEHGADAGHGDDEHAVDAEDAEAQHGDEDAHVEEDAEHH